MVKYKKFNAKLNINYKSTGAQSEKNSKLPILTKEILYKNNYFIFLLFYFICGHEERKRQRYSIIIHLLAIGILLFVL